MIFIYKNPHFPTPFLTFKKMSHILKLSSSSIQILHRSEPRRLEFKILCLLPNAIVQSKKPGRVGLTGGGNIQGRTFVANNSKGSVQSLDSSPMSIELGFILSETQFDRIIAEAQQLEEPVVIVWMASWCRKCIYLKPKLEKLAAEYFPRIHFYHIDVNNVSHKLVVQAGVTKMPTIQLWKDGEKQEEVIGGHKAHLVVNEVREMIENGCAL